MNIPIKTFTIGSRELCGIRHRLQPRTVAGWKSWIKTQWQRIEAAFIQGRTLWINAELEHPSDYRFVYLHTDFPDEGDHSHLNCMGYWNHHNKCWMNGACRPLPPGSVKHWADIVPPRTWA